jgi:hypothetical protein
VNQIAPAVRDALIDAGLAVWPGSDDVRRGRSRWRDWRARGADDLSNHGRWNHWVSVASNPDNDWDPDVWPDLRHHSPEWVVMPEKLVAVYTSALAEDYATANQLNPTTDQDDAYAVTNNWTTDRIAAVLLDRMPRADSPVQEDLGEIVGLLALDLVIPADLDAIPMEKIIEIRERYGAEFLAFGHEVEKAAAALTELTDIRDKAILDDYLHEMVTIRFAQPLDSLRSKIKRLTGDAAMMSINVKTQLPAATLAGGAWLAGSPVIAGTTAAAVGLMAVRRGIEQQRETTLSSAPAASFLLHTDAHLRPRTLLDRTLHRLARIAGTSTN